MIVGTILEKKSYFFWRIRNRNESHIEEDISLETYKRSRNFPGGLRRVRSTFQAEEIAFTFICGLGKEQII